MRNPQVAYAQSPFRRHEPRLGSQAKCMTISQDILAADWEDLSGVGRVAGKAREIMEALQLRTGPPVLFLLTAYGDPRKDDDPLKRSTDEKGKTDLEWIEDLFRLRSHTKETIYKTRRAYCFHEIEYDPVSQQRITAITFFVSMGTSLASVICMLRIEIPSLRSVAFVSCKKPAELADLRDLCEEKKDLLRTTPLGILAVIYDQRVRVWEDWVVSLWGDVNEIEVLLDMAPLEWHFHTPTPERVKTLSNPDAMNRQFAATHAQICHSHVFLAFGLRYAEYCREAMDLVEQARTWKRLQPGEREGFEAFLRPSLSKCKSTQERSMSLLERLRGLISLAANMIAQREARTNRDIAQSNLRVAQSAASDSRTMKTIGLLGVLFLPATFTTALWNVNVFDLDDDTNKIVFAVATVGLTLLVLGAWGSYMFLARKPLEWYKYREDDLESATKSMELRQLVE